MKLVLLVSMLMLADNAATSDKQAAKVTYERPSPPVQPTLLSEWRHEQKEMRKESKEEATLAKKEEHWKEKEYKMEAKIEKRKVKVLHDEEKELRNERQKAGVTDASKSTQKKEADYFRKAKKKEDHYKREEEREKRKRDAAKKEANTTVHEIQEMQHDDEEEHQDIPERDTHRPVAKEEKEHRAISETPDKVTAFSLFVKSLRVVSILGVMFISICLITTSIAWWIRVKPYRKVRSAPPVLG